jgi:hypothetical protein
MMIDELDEVALRALANALRPYLLDVEPQPVALLTPQEAATRAHAHVETIRRAGPLWRSARTTRRPLAAHRLR